MKVFYIGGEYQQCIGVCCPCVCVCVCVCVSVYVHAYVYVFRQDSLIKLGYAKV